MFAIGKLAVRRLLLAAGMFAAGQAQVAAAELMMFRRDGCPWCLRFEREIAPIYPRTAEGRAAPLRRVELSAGGARMEGLAEPVIATPTFVLMNGGREIGRITGYSNDAAFWGLLGKMLAGMEAPIHQTRGLAATVEYP